MPDFRIPFNGFLARLSRGGFIFLHPQKMSRARADDREGAMLSGNHNHEAMAAKKTHFINHVVSHAL